MKNYRVQPIYNDTFIILFELFIFCWASGDAKGLENELDIIICIDSLDIVFPSLKQFTNPIDRNPLPTTVLLRADIFFGQ